jgi:hypothetical protein
VQGVSDATFQLKNPAGTVVAATVIHGTGNQWVLDPTADLTAGTAYTATLTGGPAAIRDTANNALTTLSWSFTTAAGPADTVAPAVTTRNPAVNATSVGAAATVAATFSEVVQNVSGTTFTVKNTATGAAVAAVVSRNGTTNQWILKPGAALAANTQFTVTITGGATGVKDVVGNPLANVTWKFTTGA